MQSARAAALLLTILVFAAACGDDGSVPAESTVPTVDTTSAPPTTIAPGTSPTTVVATTPRGTSPPGDQATASDVIDGDSFMALVDDQEVEVRLLGINAPERNDCFGFEARDRLAAMLANDFVLVADTGDDVDQFGRLLRYAYVGERNVGERMVKEGYAFALATGHTERDAFRRVYRQAINTRAGMWQPDACGDATTASIGISALEFNPTGPDSDDLNGEWVTFQNAGGGDVDLSGWELRDESSRNSYEFSDGQILTGGNEVTVRVGCGEDSQLELFWCSEAPVFNNDGDSAILQDTFGNIVTEFIYEGTG